MLRSYFHVFFSGIVLRGRRCASLAGTPVLIEVGLHIGFFRCEGDRLVCR
jgi:hypothetical protein